MKRADALRKVRTFCERLDQIDLATFPIVPFKLYVFGSVLTDKPDPHDVDLVLLYDERPETDPAEIAMRLAYHEPLPFDQASTQLRRGMQMIRLFPARLTLATWEYVLLFPRGEGLRLIWKPGLIWSRLLDDIAAHPTAWQGARPADARERFDEWRAALPAEERPIRIAETLEALEAQEKAVGMND
jgi:hypothetical protein